jgi:peptidyl-prolyl cis-trans isomerase D
MMETMRNAAKSWVAKLLIGLLVISFGVWGIADIFRFSQGTDLATVGSIKVSVDQYNQAYRRFLDNLQNQTGAAISPDDARRLGIDRSVLNQLIGRAVIDDRASQLGLAVSDEQIVGETHENPDFRDAAGKFDPRLFATYLSTRGMNEAIYLGLQKQQNLRRAISDAADADVTPARTLVELQYKHDNEQRDARYFVVKATEEEVAQPTDADIKAEYDKNIALYTAPEYRSIALVKADPEDVIGRVSVSEQDLKDAYEKHKATYFTPERRTVLQLTFPSLDEAQKAKERIAGGTDFLALAKEMGFKESDITFADKVKTDFFDKTIAEAAFSTPEGSVSDPIKGGLATVLLKVVKVSPEHQGTFDEVRGDLEKRLKLERAKDEIDSIYNAVEDARAGQQSFEDIAKKNNLPFQVVGPVDAQGMGKDGKAIDFPHKAEVLKAAFASDVGVDNSPISIEDGYTWYDVREVIPSAPKPLDAVKDEAKAHILADRVRALALEKAGKLAERAASGSSLDSLAVESGASIETVQGLKRDSTSGAFDAAAVSALFSVKPDGFATASEADGKGAKVIQSQPVLLPPFDPASADAKKIATDLGLRTADDLAAAYLIAMQKAANVTINEALWRQVAGEALPQ